MTTRELTQQHADDVFLERFGRRARVIRISAAQAAAIKRSLRPGASQVTAPQRPAPA